jgi:hypothetical protein
MKVLNVGRKGREKLCRWCGMMEMLLVTMTVTVMAVVLRSVVWLAVTIAAAADKMGRPIEGQGRWDGD